MSPQDSSPIFSSLASDADMIDLVQEFVGALAERVSAIEAAVDTNSVPELTRLAHQLKGAGGGYGFDVLSAAAAELETASKAAESTEAVRTQVDELISLCRRATAAAPS